MTRLLSGVGASLRCVLLLQVPGPRHAPSMTSSEVNPRELQRHRLQRSRHLSREGGKERPGMTTTVTAAATPMPKTAPCSGPAEASEATPHTRYSACHEEEVLAEYSALDEAVGKPQRGTRRESRSAACVPFRKPSAIAG